MKWCPVMNKLHDFHKWHGKVLNEIDRCVNENRDLYPNLITAHEVIRALGFTMTELQLLSESDIAPSAVAKTAMICQFFKKKIQERYVENYTVKAGRK